MQGNNGVSILTRDVKPAVVAELDVKRVNHRRNVLRGHHQISEVESIAVSTISDDVAVLAPGVGNIQIVADKCKTAGNMQRVRIGRWVKQQGMLLAKSAVVLKDTDVVNA